jgi:hypothetical protein
LSFLELINLLLFDLRDEMLFLLRPLFQNASPIKSTECKDKKKKRFETMELSLLCCDGDIDKVKEYLTKENLNESKLIIEEKEEDEWILIQYKELTPIICAIQNNHLSILKYLHEQGANINFLQ